MFKKLARKVLDFLVEASTRVFMNLIKMVLGAAIGMTYVSVQYGKPLVAIRSTPEWAAAVVVLTAMVLIISIIETFADWEYSPAAKAGEKENASKETQKETKAASEAKA